MSSEPCIVRDMPTPRLTDTMTKTRAQALVAAWRKAGNVSTLAAADLGLPRRTFSDQLRVAQGILGETQAMVAPVAVPPGQRVGKTTVQYNAQGEVVSEWRRLFPEADGLQAFVDELCKISEGKAPLLPPRVAKGKDDLLLEVPLFDCHFGKYCWAPETGQDYDLSKAEQAVAQCVSYVAGEAGPVGRAVLVIGGDFFHSDTRHNMTERGGHNLDVDSRQWKVWQVAARAIHTSVAHLALTAEKIEIVAIPGNHDWESMFHLSRLLEAYYRNDKRVLVHASPKSRQYVRHGKVLLGFAHGHLMKSLHDYATLMANEQPSAWAETAERAWHLGHIHKHKTLRVAGTDIQHGVQVEHLESLAATDAWHHEQGYVGSPRRLEAFVWSAAHGLRRRIYINAKEVGV